MKHMTRLFVLLLSAIAIASCGGGTSSGSALDEVDPSASAPISSAAAAMAVSASEAGGDVGHMSTIVEVTITPIVKSASQSWKDGVITFTFTDHEMAEKNGSGTFVVNGTSTMSASAKAQAITEAGGDLDVQLKDVTKILDVDGKTYTNTINGKLKITFSGTELPVDIKESQIYTDIDYTITGSNLAITGTAAGTITDLNVVRNMKIMMVDGVAKRVSVCSGTATVKTDAGIETCTYQADCNTCS